MKGFTLLMSLVAVAAAVVAGLLFFKIDYDKASLLANNKAAQMQLASSQQRAADNAAERDQLAADVGRLQNELSELRARNTTLEARNNQLGREVTRQRDELAARDQSTQGVQQELASLRKQLADSRTALATTVGGASPEQVAAYEERIRDLEDQLIAMRRTQAPPNPALASAPAGLTGQVIEVGPKSAFVVLNIGAKHGATVDLDMVLRRGSTVLARIRLTDVRDSYSVANVVPETGAGNIRPGDVASRP
jgi:peptidoglycan hydrolase CwlO-like protein